MVVGTPAGRPAGHVQLMSRAQTTLHGCPCALAVAPRGHGDASGAITEIGVGIEETPLGEATLAQTRRLAVQLDAGVRVVEVIVPPAMMWISPAYAYMTQLAELVQDRVAEARERLALLDDCTVEVFSGEPVQHLREVSGRVDLLVLGSRSYGPVRSLLVGSTTEGLLDDAACPVLILASLIAPSVAAVAAATLFA
jgi:nucleotide-binding universal stress UspA family protein